MTFCEDKKMPRYKMLVMTSPVEGREQEFNDWYQNIHLGQVVAVEGIKSAQRFRVCRTYKEAPAHRYLAIYDIETDNVDEPVAGIVAKMGTNDMIISDAMDPNTITVMYEEIGSVVEHLDDRR
jgi:hypothetical protein